MRTTDDPKEGMIKVRMSTEMIEYLRDQSERSDMSVSEYVRNLVEQDMNTCYASKKVTYTVQ